MKFKRKLLYFGMALFTITGCNSHNNSVKGNDIGSFLTQDGMYFIKNTNQDTSMLDYHDFKTGKTIPLGDDIGCKEGDSNCKAVQLTKYKGRNLVTLKSYHNDLYLFYQSDQEDSYLMKADSKGDNLKTVFTLPKGCMMQNFDIYEDKLFYVYNKMAYLDDHKATYGTSGNNIVAVYDLKTKQQKDLTKDNAKKDGFSMFLGFDKKKAYYTDYSYENKERPIYAYDIDKGNVSLIDQKNTIDTSMLYDGKLYTADEKTKKVYSYDILTHKKAAIVSFQPYSEGTLTTSCSDGLVQLIYTVHPNTNDTKRYVQVYDVKDKKFLFDNYQQGYDVSYRSSAGYIATKDNMWGILDKNMQFKPF